MTPPLSARRSSRHQPCANNTSHINGQRSVDQPKTLGGGGVGEETLERQAGKESLAPELLQGLAADRGLGLEVGGLLEHSRRKNEGSTEVKLKAKIGSIITESKNSLLIFSFKQDEEKSSKNHSEQGFRHGVQTLSGVTKLRKKRNRTTAW